MAVSIKQALQAGIDSHKAGNLIDAKRYYTAILTVQPNHPDANHNMGVLAVSLGKLDDALSFFKLALNGNPQVPQFWVSQINLLIKMEQFAHAELLLKNAEELNVKDEALCALQLKLSQITSNLSEFTKNDISYTSNKMSLEKAIKLAKKKAGDGFITDARNIYVDILTKFPNSKRARDGLKSLNKKNHPKNIKSHEPPKHQVDLLLKLHSEGQHKTVVEKATVLAQKFPQSLSLYSIIGSAKTSLGQFDAAIEYYNQALNIKPDHEGILYNLGNIHRKKSNYKEAINFYQRAIAIKPDFPQALYNLGLSYQHTQNHENAIIAYKKSLIFDPRNIKVYNNMGAVIHKLGNSSKAISVYQKALSIAPECAELHNNLGILRLDTGEVTCAVKSLQKALELHPNYEDALVTILRLKAQLLKSNYFGDVFLETIKHKYDPTMYMKPRYQVVMAIIEFLQCNLDKAHIYLAKFKSSLPEELSNLSRDDAIFCFNYSEYLNGLIGENTINKKFDREFSTIYHIGESHCLSYAHKNIHVFDNFYKIRPMITFGAKAFHFSKPNVNKFKAITEKNFRSIEHRAIIFVSFGEIDCRRNEGFLAAIRKSTNSLSELISQTVNGYLKWFSEINEIAKHKIIFFNVPAPVYNNELNYESNDAVSNTINVFNYYLAQYCHQYGFFLVDTHKFTANETGFSNGMFHVDKFHLGSVALPEIEKQLCALNIED